MPVTGGGSLRRVLGFVLAIAATVGEPCDDACQGQQQAAGQVSALSGRLFALRQKGPALDTVDKERTTRGAECDRSVAEKKKAQSQAHAAPSPGAAFDARLKQERDEGPRRAAELTARALQLRTRGPDLPAMDAQLQQAQRDGDGRAQALEQQLAAARAEHSRLIDERGRSLEELDLGFFCSRCGNTASQLGGMERFKAHLHDVNAVAVPAPPDRRAAKAEEYRKLIAAAFVRVRALEDQLTQVRTSTRAAVDRLTAQKNDAWPAHHKAVAAAEAAARDEDGRWRAGVAELKKQRREALERHAKSLTDADAAVKGEESRCDAQRRELAAKREQVGRAYEAEVAQLTSALRAAETALASSRLAAETVKARARLDAENAKLKDAAVQLTAAPPPPSAWRVVNPGPMDDAAQLPWAEDVEPPAAPPPAPLPAAPPPTSLPQVQGQASSDLTGLLSPPRPAIDTASLSRLEPEPRPAPWVARAAAELRQGAKNPGVTAVLDATRESLRRMAQNMMPSWGDYFGGRIDLNVKDAVRASLRDVRNEFLAPLVRAAINAAPLPEDEKFAHESIFNVLFRRRYAETVDEALRYGVRGVGLADDEAPE